MKRNIRLILMILTALLLVACTGDKNASTDVSTTTTKAATETTTITTVPTTVEQTTQAETTQQEQAFIKEIQYSNLFDKTTQDMLKTALLKTGIAEARVAITLENIEDYNQTIEGIDLVESGFKASEQLIPQYDSVAIDEKWLKKYELFIGRNCRITAFDLMADNITIGKPDVTDNKMLFMDETALADCPNKTYSETELSQFRTLFGDVPAEMTKDITVHLKAVKDYWQAKGVTFNSKASQTGGASLITVWFHSDLDNNLFVGHTGVLFYDNDDLLFLEKISFQEPYQLLKFSSRQQLNDYLMNRYDNTYNQPVARPFIMENDELLEGYRPNPNNIE